MIGERRSRVYAYIVRSLASGKLNGGDRISEIALAESLDVSRTPVREAIRQLEAEGVVVQFPRVGTFVRKVTRRDLLELYEEREAIEPYVAALAAERIDDESLAALAKNCRRMKALAKQLTSAKETPFDSALAQEMFQLDGELHQLIAKGAGNGRLQLTLQGASFFRNLFIGIRDAQAAIPQSQIMQTAQEHQAILDGLQKRDPEAARAAMLTHISLAKHWAVKLFDEASDDGSSTYYEQVSAYM